MNVLSPESQVEFLSLLEHAVAAHANVVQVRLVGETAIAEIVATGTVVASREMPTARCAELLPSAFALCDEADTYQYGASRSARMTGLKVALPQGVVMVFLQFFPARDGQRHLVARLTYDSDTCCGTCGG